jgi:retron-type reverse transcriptase
MESMSRLLKLLNFFHPLFYSFFNCSIFSAFFAHFLLTTTGSEQRRKSPYGYRPNKTAIDAVGVARQRCWQYDYVIDMDIKGLFDNIDHELLMKAVRKHVKEQWILLYIERWLKAPFQNRGELIPRTAGTPQGGVISPILANLFMHYAFDVWMCFWQV